MAAVCPLSSPGNHHSPRARAECPACGSEPAKASDELVASRPSLAPASKRSERGEIKVSWGSLTDTHEFDDDTGTSLYRTASGRSVYDPRLRVERTFDLSVRTKPSGEAYVNVLDNVVVSFGGKELVNTLVDPPAVGHSLELLEYRSPESAADMARQALAEVQLEHVGQPVRLVSETWDRYNNLLRLGVHPMNREATDFIEDGGEELSSLEPDSDVVVNALAMYQNPED